MRALALLAVLAAAPASAQELSVTDTTGAEVALPASAERVVAIDSAAYVLMADLGVRPVGSAVSDGARADDRFFADGEAIPNVGTDPSTPDGELVAAAAPDLIVGWVDEHRPMLETVAPYYAFADILTAQDFIEAFRELAALTGQQERAEAVVTEFVRRTAAYAALVPSKPRVLELYLLGEPGRYDVGTGTYTGCQLLALIVTCDWTNPDGSPNAYETSIEGVLELDPDAILLGFYVPWEQVPDALERLEADPLWNQLRAVREGNLIVPTTLGEFDADPVTGFSRYLDRMMTRLFPDTFPAPLTDEQVAAALQE